MTNETHDPNLTSWVESANRPDSDFPIQNLPFGVFRPRDESPRVGVAIGDSILDAAECVRLGYLSGAAAQALQDRDLNAFLRLGRAAWSDARLQISRLLRSDSKDRLANVLHDAAACQMLLPVEIGDYTDFYCSVFHATNVGSMFRPDNPLMPNYKYLPVGYHGRASSVVVSGTPVRRPSGQLEANGSVTFEPSRLLDYELEVGFFVGPGNDLGQPIPIAEAGDHIFGLCLLNDWSARDIQRWEYQPLGPFLAKSFGTSISPWIVTTEALAPFRAPAFPRPESDPRPLPYLDDKGDQASGGIDLTLEVWLKTERMSDPARLSRGNFRDMYWTIAQMLAHHASNGCNLRPGDLIGSGTVSGPGKEERGCLLELTWRGAEPLELGGETRKFLEDGDEVILRGYCEREGARRIGFGECRGTVIG
ncbi:MAG: fumarylacetoacetase [Bryobacteraceae bacterium]|nr:fumarylacetoacetase [Bryobacteraceae bacterium]